MLKDFTICPHCKAKGNSGIMMRADENTAVVSRSDGKTFHLYLFKGPIPLPSKSGGIVAGREAVTFFYALDPASIEHESVQVTIRTTVLSGLAIHESVRKIADKLAELLDNGQRLQPGYFFDQGELFAQASEKVGF